MNRLRGLFVVLVGLAAGACSLMERDLPLVNVNEARDCYALGRHASDGALQCYELRGGQCEAVGKAQPSKPLLRLPTRSVSEVRHTPVPRGPDETTSLLLTAVHCDGQNTVFEGALFDPLLGEVLEAPQFEVLDEKELPWIIPQMAFAMADAAHVVALAIRTEGCRAGSAELLTAALQERTTFVLTTQQASCDSGARWPAVALHCPDGNCGEGFSVHLATHVCVEQACNPGAEPGLCESSEESSAPLQAEFFRWASEGLSERSRLRLGVASARVPPAVMALELAQPVFVVVHGAESAEGCTPSGSRGAGIVVRTLSREGKAACLHIPASGVKRVAVGHGPVYDRGRHEELLVAWSAAESDQGALATLTGAIVEAGPDGPRLKETLTVATDVDPTIAPAVAYAARGAAVDAPRGFWSVTWTRGSDRGQAMVGRVASDSFEALGTTPLASRDSGVATGFAFDSGESPLSYGVTNLGAKNVASTWTLMCAK